MNELADADYEVWQFERAGEWLWRCHGIRHCQGDLRAGHADQIAAEASYAEHAARDHGSEPTAGQLHARRAHPGFEYATTEGPRKQWDDTERAPEGDGWERNTDAGRDGWERLDYTEESYWRRTKEVPRG